MQELFRAGNRSPFRAPRRRKDRHGRGQARVVIPPGLPLWNTRGEQFTDALSNLHFALWKAFPEVASIEFAVEESPPSSPAPWENHDVSLARVFPRDRTRGLRDRIVFYRQPIMRRCRRADCVHLLRLLVADRVSRVLAISPDELLRAM